MKEGDDESGKDVGVYERKTYLELLSRLGANTRRLREAKGWTQAEAAEACSMATLQLQMVELAKRNFTGTVLARLCDGFGVGVEELLKEAAPLAKRGRGRPRNTDG